MYVLRVKHIWLNYNIHVYMLKNQEKIQIIHDKNIPLALNCKIKYDQNSNFKEHTNIDISVFFFQTFNVLQ